MATEKNSDRAAQPESDREENGDAGSATTDRSDDDAPHDSLFQDDEQLQQANDRVLRLQAELDNVRRRTSREILEQQRYAALPLIRDLLPVLDNIHRAIDAAEKGDDASGLLDGFKLVQQQLETVLQQHECTEIDALHEPFDPHRHEAISQLGDSEHPPGTILHVVQV
ncbi:MAG: nucleotide exchange factor GrpE, partial [Pirellulales bacterium]